MINIVVWSNHTVSIERKDYNITGTESMIEFLQDLLDKVWYSGERICLEVGTVDSDKGTAMFKEIVRFSGYPNTAKE